MPDLPENSLPVREPSARSEHFIALLVAVAIVAVSLPEGSHGSELRTALAVLVWAVVLLGLTLGLFLNDEDVRVLDGLDTSASESDTVVILPAMAGGSL